MNHSPTPWKIDCGHVLDAINNEIPFPDAAYRCPSPLERVNATHIVRCVNAHDELVAALEECNAILERERGIEADAWQRRIGRACEQICAALAKAKGEAT
jgi:hypothetical protein